MKAITTSLSVLALAAAVSVGCSDSGTGLVGEKPGERRTPSASPPTAVPDAPARSQGGGTTDTTPVPAPPPSTTSPSDRPASR